MSKILVTGGGGYLGSVLVPMLLEQGHEVTVIDIFQHKQPSLMAWCHHPNLKIICDDIRDVTSSLLYDIDVIIPLAALVGAPLCDRDPIIAFNINTAVIEQICNIARSDQTILFPMTNSGYGTGGEAECTEESPLLPISIYGQSKVAAEKAVLAHPRGISFRFATLFGCSPRMRLDLLVNDFCHRAVRDHSLTLFEGNFRRNYLHVRDAASVFLFALDNVWKYRKPTLGAAPEAINADFMFGQAYNVGLSSANLNKRELCKKIAEHVPGFVFHESAVGTDPDKRDYIVSNAKIEALGWRPQCSLDDGIKELIKGFAMPLENNYRNA